MPWFIKTKDGEHGPIASDKLKELALAGRVSAKTLVRRDGHQSWIKAETVPNLFPAPDKGQVQSAETTSTGSSIGSAVINSLSGAAKTMSKAVGNIIEARATNVNNTVENMSLILDSLTTEGQSPSVIEKILPKVNELLTQNESVQYIAVQAKPVMNMFPDCVALTNRRFIIMRPKVLGRMTFEDYIWRDLHNVQVEENMIGATITFHTTSGTKMSLDYLPKAQAKAIYRYSQEREEEVREERRQREMEERRAAAAQTVIQTAVQSPPQQTMPATAPSPLEKMQQLKQLLDAGLLTQAEFDAKKSEILRAL